MWHDGFNVISNLKPCVHIVVTMWRLGFIRDFVLQIALLLKRQSRGVHRRSAAMITPRSGILYHRSRRTGVGVACPTPKAARPAVTVSTRDLFAPRFSASTVRPPTPLNSQRSICTQTSIEYKSSTSFGQEKLSAACSKRKQQQGQQF